MQVATGTVVNGKIVKVIDLYSVKTKRGVVLTFPTKAKGKRTRIAFVAGTYGFLPTRIEGFGLSRF